MSIANKFFGSEKTSDHLLEVLNCGKWRRRSKGMKREKEIKHIRGCKMKNIDNLLFGRRIMRGGGGRRRR